MNTCFYRIYIRFVWSKTRNW